MKSSALGLLSCIAFSSAATGETPADLTLWYPEPADEWIEALPIGNGRFGAMIFGQPEDERFQLNDVTVWSGNPQPNADRKDAWKNLPQLRRLIREDRLEDMETVMRSGTDQMQTFDAALAALVREELITLETGFNYADDQAAFKRLAAGTTAGADKAGLIGAF